MNPTFDTLQILTAFAIMGRRAVDELRSQCLNRSQPGPSYEFTEALHTLRDKALSGELTGRNTDYARTVFEVSDALFEQLGVSHLMLRLAYRNDRASGRMLHNHLIEEALTRAETILQKCIELAIQRALTTRCNELPMD